MYGIFNYKHRVASRSFTLYKKAYFRWYFHIENPIMSTETINGNILSRDANLLFCLLLWSKSILNIFLTFNLKGDGKVSAHRSSKYCHLYNIWVDKFGSSMWKVKTKVPIFLGSMLPQYMALSVILRLVCQKTILGHF